VKYFEQSRQRGISCNQAAQVLGVAPRTARHWKRHATASKRCTVRGRQPKECPAAVRNEVVRFLREVSGPAVGLASLMALFRGVARCILEDLLRRYRRVWRARYRQSGFRLVWHRAGVVWATDFSEASHSIDGVCDYLFPVRDLGSHQQLAWHPFGSQTAAETLPVLKDLFRQFGPPLVLKNDNGSAFIAEAFGALLAEYEVLQLFSPARHPQYNGALERSNGTLKTYTHQHAVAAGHPFRWTSDDVEQARELANTLSRPWGYRGPTPQEAWDARTPITAEDRRQFLEHVEGRRVEARRDLGLDETAVLNRADHTRVDRLAISRALVDLGYLTITRESRPAKKAKRLSRADLVSRATTHLGKSLATLVAPPVDAPQKSPRSPEDAELLAPTPESVLSAEHSHGMLAACAATIIVPASASTDESSSNAEELPEMLAMRLAGVTMRIDLGIDVSSSNSPLTPMPAHVEQTHISWLRRCVTLILSFAKSAIISQ
jgi:transposase InsO family protein